MTKPTKWVCAQRRRRSTWAFTSLIRVFAVRMKTAWVLSTERTTKTPIRLGGCPGWSESSLGAHSFCWFCHVVAQIRQMREDDFVVFTDGSALSNPRPTAGGAVIYLDGGGASSILLKKESAPWAITCSGIPITPYWEYWLEEWKNSHIYGLSSCNYSSF